MGGRVSEPLPSDPSDCSESPFRRMVFQKETGLNICFFFDVFRKIPVIFPSLRKKRLQFDFKRLQ